MTEIDIRHLWYRPSKTPSYPLPFGVRSVGNYEISPNFYEKPLERPFLQLFWGIEGEGELFLRGKSFLLKPHHIFIYFPGDEHFVRALSPVWKYRWMTLDGEHNSTVVRSFGLDRGLRSANACPETLFIELEQSVKKLSPEGERQACVTAFAILEAASSLRKEEKAVSSKVVYCLKLIENEFANPLLGVERMAAETNLNRSFLSRLFKKQTGKSPGDYLISLRIQKAISLLKESDISIGAVAFKVGYSDPNYFTKAFRRILGVTPGLFRKHL